MRINSFKYKLIAAIVLLFFLGVSYLTSTTSFRLKSALYYTKIQDYDKAISLYKQILRKETLSPRYKTLNTERISDIYFEMAKLYLVSDKFAEAALMLKELKEINQAYKLKSLPRFSNFMDYKRFGCQLADKGLYGLALEQFKKMVELAPDNPLSHYQLGLAYQRYGMVKDAAVHFQKVIELSEGEPDNQCAYAGESYYYLGAYLESIGDIEKAKEDYGRAIELDCSSIVTAYNRLKSLYSELGDMENANSVALKLSGLKPSYEVNHRFTNGLDLAGYSLDEKEFELFDEGRVTFFWEKSGKRFYEIKEVKNLVPDFGFEMDIPGKNFPSGWQPDSYSGEKDRKYYDVVINNKGKIDEKNQCLALSVDSKKTETGCAADIGNITKDSYYLQAGYLKSPDDRAWMGVEKNTQFYSYAALGITPSQWEHVSRVTSFSAGIDNCSFRALLVSYAKACRAYFDDILFIKLELPNITD